MVWYDGDEPKKAKQHGNEMGEMDIGLDKDYERGYTRKPDIWEIPHSYSKSLAPFIEQIVACGIFIADNKRISHLAAQLRILTNWKFNYLARIINVFIFTAS